MPPVGGIFSPLDLDLGLRVEGYSPSVLRKIEYAGSNALSFSQASEALMRLAEVSISDKHVQRLTEKLGRERQERRDADVAAFREKRLEPTYKEAPRTVAIHVDAGKVQLRKDDGAKGVREPHWGDTKVACLATYEGRTFVSDPQPEPPKVFLDAPRVVKLCAELARVRNRPETLVSPSPSPELPTTDLSSDSSERASPTPLLRTAVATMANAESFGWLVAAEAHKRRFYEAKHAALVGDGGNWIVPLGQFQFHGWTQILDFVHLLGHLYEAAQCAWPSAPKRAWDLYEKLLRLAWAGRVHDLLTELEYHHRRVSVPSVRRARRADVHKLELAIGFIDTNAARMDYPRFRREGLPLTSTLVESLIKQFNQRMKGTEKFWINGGAEAVLQVRAAYLSEDARVEEHYKLRPLGRVAGRPPARASA